MPSMLATCTPRRSTSSGGIDDHRVVRGPPDDQREVLLAGRGGEQLGVGEAVEPLRVAGAQHAGGDDQRAGAGPAAGLVDAGDRARARAAAGWSAASRCRRGARPPAAGAARAAGRARAGAARRAASGGVRASGAGLRRDGGIGTGSVRSGRGASVARRRSAGTGRGRLPARSPERGAAGERERQRPEQAQRQRRAPPAGVRRRIRPAALVCGFAAAIQPNRANGSTISRALPITFSTGTGPWPGTRESAELLRLSPIIHSCPAGTVTGPNGVLPGRAGLGQVVDVGLVERLAVDHAPGCGCRSTARSARRRR